MSIIPKAHGHRWFRAGFNFPVAEVALLSGSVNSTSMFVQGRSYAIDSRNLDNSVNRLVISPHFFEQL